MPYTLLNFDTLKICSGIFNPKDMDCGQYDSLTSHYSPVYELNTEHIRSRNLISKITNARYATLPKVENRWEFAQSSFRTYPVEEIAYSEPVEEMYPGNDYEIYAKTVDCIENVDHGNMNMYNEEDFGCEII